MVACVSSHKKEKGVASDRPFPVIQMPSMIEQDQKAEYLAEHFWDEFLDTSKLEFCDSLHLSAVPLPEVEQAMANYQMLLGQFPLSVAEKLMGGFTAGIIGCRDASEDMFKGLCRIVEKYYYDPNSPLRDEDIYGVYASMMAKCPGLEESQRVLYSYQAKACSCNRRGTRAAEFQFTDRYGYQRSLYGIDALHTILFFSNPGCHACKDIIEALAGDGLISSAIDDGELAVVNIYIDEDLKEWYDYLPNYPDTWYTGYDHNHIIRDDELYNVRAIPSLYLLDKDKVVVLKDTTPERLMSTLQNIL